MKLSPDQITTLKKLISFKGYEEIDVQYEILDHVACRIEGLITEKPSLKLDDAFRKAHSEFGIFGFADLADSYREGIRKKFWQRYRWELLGLFTSYRLVFLILLGWTFHFLSQNFTLFGERLTAPGWATVGLLVSAIFFVMYYFRVRSRYKNYATFNQALSFFTAWQFLFQVTLQGTKHLVGTEIPTEFTFRGFMAWFTILVMLIGWISLFLLPKIVQKSAEETERLKAIYEG